MVFACLPSGLSVADLSGRRQRVELFGSAAHSCRCFWKASTGAESSEHGRLKSRCDDNDDSPLFMHILWMHSELIDGILRAWIASRCLI